MPLPIPVTFPPAPDLDAVEPAEDLLELLRRQEPVPSERRFLSPEFVALAETCAN